MRLDLTYCCLLLASLLFVASVPRAQANSVPPFVPNVVDTSGTLTAEDRENINAAIADVRAKADIWGAVLIVDRLQGDTIESLAEKTFREWKLGRAKVDNGLLLVLSMQDRKSRFEVGYGLEGDLPDVVALKALDHVLAPHMRRGEVKAGIIQAFAFLAGVKSKDPQYQAAVVEANREAEAASEGDINVEHGAIGLAIFYVCLWLVRPFTEGRARELARRLEGRVENYRFAEDKEIQKGANGSLPVKIFMSINPGIFIFLGSGLNIFIFAGLVALMLIMSLSFVWRTIRPYRSPAAFKAFVAKQRQRNAEMVQKGYMREASLGRFEYTQAYYSSEEYKASRRSSSSSSSSSRSSSGGGRSGGGGASSGW